MKITLEDRLFDTTDRHSNMVDAMAYMISAQYAKLYDDYLFIYIKRKPKYMPNSIYKWFLKRFINIAHFK